jgi:hypothetical protein
VTILDDITKQAPWGHDADEEASQATYAEVTAPDEEWGPRDVADHCTGDNARFIAHARTALPDLAKAWLAVCEALEEVAVAEAHSGLTHFVDNIRASILRRLSK